jgi:hypothetical protein
MNKQFLYSCQLIVLLVTGCTEPNTLKNVNYELKKLSNGRYFLADDVFPDKIYINFQSKVFLCSLFWGGGAWQSITPFSSFVVSFFYCKFLVL